MGKHSRPLDSLLSFLNSVHCIQTQIKLKKSFVITQRHAISGPPLDPDTKSVLGFRWPRVTREHPHSRKETESSVLLKLIQFF